MHTPELTAHTTNSQCQYVSTVSTCRLAATTCYMLSKPQSVFNRLAGVVVPLLWELESSEKFIAVDVNSVGPWESLTVEKPAKHKP